MRISLAFILIFFSSCISESDSITVDDARANYFQNEKSINDLRSYFKTICPDSLDVSFGFRENSDTYVFGIDQVATHKGIECEMNSDEMKLYLTELAWTTTTIDSLVNKLKRINCYQISGGNPAMLYFHLDEVCSLEYTFYTKAHDSAWLEEIRRESEKKIINDSTFVHCDCVL